VWLDGSFSQGRTAAKRQNVGKPAHGETPREGSFGASDPHNQATSSHVGRPPATALEQSGGLEVPGSNPGARLTSPADTAKGEFPRRVPSCGSFSVS
jgi:hypothetical protein